MVIVILPSLNQEFSVLNLTYTTLRGVICCGSTVVPKEEPIGQEPGSSRGSSDPSGSPPGDAGGSAFNLGVTLKARLGLPWWFRG